MAMFNDHVAGTIMNSNNVSSANFRPVGSGSEGAQEVSARPTGWFSSSVKSFFNGLVTPTSASVTAIELPQGGNIRQREVSAVKPQISEERRSVYKKNLIDINRLLSKLTEDIYSLVDIPTTAQCAAEILEENEQDYGASPASLIKDLRVWNQSLKLGLDSRYFDSSQTISSEFATQTLKEFRTRLDKILLIPDLADRLKSFSRGIAAMRPECETNRLALEDPLCLPAAEDKVILTAKRLGKLIDDGFGSVTQLLSATPGNKKNDDLKKELDLCIQNILFMQGTKEATITEVQI